jgi:hypothetical protein
VVTAVSEQDGVTAIRFRTPDSLRAAVLWALDALPPAGFVVGRGDAEPSEADVPFRGGGLNGVFRIGVADACRTEWLLAYTGVYVGPATSPAPSPSPSSLPFG